MSAHIADSTLSATTRPLSSPIILTYQSAKIPYPIRSTSLPRHMHSTGTDHSPPLPTLGCAGPHFLFCPTSSPRSFLDPTGACALGCLASCCGTTDSVLSRYALRSYMISVSPSVT